LEQQILNFKIENQRILEEAMREKDKFQKIRQELEEAKTLKKVHLFLEIH